MLLNSTVSLHDTISDFSISQGDRFDFTNIAGVGATPGSVQGLLVDGSVNVNAHSIAWVQSGGNTIVLVNTSDNAEAQTSAQMEIILNGVNAGSLNASFFFHI